MFTPQEMDSESTLRDAIRILLGPKPQVNMMDGSGAILHDIERQKSELIAYRAKVVALIEMLDGGIKAGGEPIIGRKPFAAKISARPKNQAAA